MEIRKLTPGDRILDYRILERLGEGGFGEVFRAEHEVLGRVVAIKVPRDASSLASLRQEGVVQAALDHPAIVRTLELSISHDPPYVVMEYVHGASLADTLKREGPLPWRRAAKILLEVAQALSHAHGHGVIHGDVKPGNVLIERSKDSRGDGRVLLTDFGLGRCFEGPQGSVQISRSLELATSGAEVQGTIRYLAPELLRGETADERADVYSFGVLLFEVLTGRLPEGREVPSDLVRDLPAELDRIFARTFTRRERRPRSFAPTIEDLKLVLGEKPAQPAAPPTALAAIHAVHAIPADAVKAVPAQAERLHDPRPSLCAVKRAEATRPSPAAACARAPEPRVEAPVPTPALVCKHEPPATVPTPLEAGFTRWRDAIVTQLRARMLATAGVAASEGHGFDVCFGVSADGEPHHRVYALHLPILDAASARATVSTARSIFEREKGIWEKEVTFCVVAREVRDLEQVLWAFKSFSMGWWRRRRMMLQDVSAGRLYAAELGCDPRGNPLKRAFLEASAGAVAAVPATLAEPVLVASPRRCSARGTLWGAGLAVVMAIGLVSSVMAIEFGSRYRKNHRRGKPTPGCKHGAEAAAVDSAGPGAVGTALAPAMPIAFQAEVAAPTSAAPAAAAPAPVAPAIPERTPDDFTPTERPVKQYF